MVTGLGGQPKAQTVMMTPAPAAAPTKAALDTSGTALAAGRAGTVATSGRGVVGTALTKSTILGVG
jgi:hypothetical protein